MKGTSLAGPTHAEGNPVLGTPGPGAGTPPSAQQVLAAVETARRPAEEALRRAAAAEAELSTNEDEIRPLARLGSQKGQIEADEAAMIGKVFQLNDLTARDLMTPRAAVPTMDGAPSKEGSV